MLDQRDSLINLSHKDQTLTCGDNKEEHVAKACQSSTQHNQRLHVKHNMDQGHNKYDRQNEINKFCVSNVQCKVNCSITIYELSVFFTTVSIPLSDVCVCVCVCVVSVIVVHSALSPCVVDGCSRNPFYYYLMLSA